MALRLLHGMKSSFTAVLQQKLAAIELGGDQANGLPAVVRPIEYIVQCGLKCCALLCAAEGLPIGLQCRDGIEQVMQTPVEEEHAQVP